MPGLDSEGLAKPPPLPHLKRTAFHELADSVGVGLIVADTGGGILHLNSTALGFLRYTQQEVAAGLVRWNEITPPEFAALDADAVRQCLETGKLAPYEKSFIAKGGKRVSVLVGSAQVEVVEGRTEVTAFLFDLTDRKQNERAAFLVRLDDATRPLGDVEDIMQIATRLLGQQLKVNRCVYGEVDKDNSGYTIVGGYYREAQSMVGSYRLDHLGKVCAQLMREALPFVVEDAENDPRVADVQDLFRRMEICSAIRLPVYKDARLVGFMGVHQKVPRKWCLEEIELVQAVANRCWESMERARVMHQLQMSERRLRLAQKAARIGTFEWSVPEDWIVWNPEQEDLFGLREGAFEGGLRDWSKRVVAEDAEQVLAGIRECFARQQAEYIYEFRAILPNGETRWLRGQAQISYNKAGEPLRMLGINMDIDAQKQAELQLRQQWHTFDTVLSNTPSFTYIFNLNGCFTYINRALLSLWQMRLEDAVGKNFHDLRYEPELATRLQQQIQQVITTTEPLTDRMEYTSALGESRFYEYTFVPVLATNGAVEAVAGSSFDITEHKREKDVIEVEAHRWRGLLLQSPSAVAVLRGAEHRFDGANAEYCRLVGLSSEALAGKTVLQASPEVEGQQYIKVLDQVYRTGEPFVGHEWPLQIAHAGGPRDYWIDFTYLATRDGAGEIDGILAHVTDITSKVLARKNIEESERQFRTLAETIPHLAWMADATGYIFWYNQRWYDYTGTTFAEMEGWDWQKVHDPTILPDVMEKWKAGIVSGKPVDLVFPLRGADGTFRTFLTRVEPVLDAEGRVSRWFGTNTDISEQQKSQEELRRVNRELEEFAYVASHDLQEPLRMVNIYTQLILRALPETVPLIQQHAAYVRQGVLRMETLIRDLLTFSRMVQTDETPGGKADLAASLRTAVDVLRLRLDESGAVLQVEALPTVFGDESQLALVFQNILANAMKYRKHDTRLAIRISAEKQGDDWIVSVEDNGIGFHPQYAERIFGLFKRLHKDEYPGTGLGLAITQRIVERYGGRIWAEGRLDHGATFRIALRPA